MDPPEASWCWGSPNPRGQSNHAQCPILRPSQPSSGALAQLVPSGPRAAAPTISSAAAGEAAPRGLQARHGRPRLHTHRCGPPASSRALWSLLGVKLEDDLLSVRSRRAAAGKRRRADPQRLAPHGDHRPYVRHEDLRTHVAAPESTCGRRCHCTRALVQCTLRRSWVNPPPLRSASVTCTAVRVRDAGPGAAGRAASSGRRGGSCCRHTPCWSC